MGQYQDVTIKSVIEDINKTYFVPDIQREYVWLSDRNSTKIEDLFDSLLRDYPISTFLIWKLKKADIESSKRKRHDDEKINIQLYKFVENYDERHPHNEKIDVEKISANELFIILDGQQRLTSLYLGLKGSKKLKKKGKWKSSRDAYEEGKLYLNLKKKPDDENHEDNYDFQFLSDDEISKYEGDETVRWFKVGKILEMTTGDLLRYFKEHSLDDNESDMLLKLHKAFCEDYRISYYAETDKELEKVLKIFIRVNSGGTKLSYSDLLMSILTANFSSEDIKDSINEFVDSLKANGFKKMGRDQILKTCLLLTDSRPDFVVKNFNKTTIRKIEDNWERIQECIDSTTTLLAEFGYKHQLASGYIITAIAYFYSKYGKINAKDAKEIKMFVRLAQITSYFTNSLDGKLSTICNIIKKNQSFADVNQKLASDKTWPLYITEDDIERLVDSSNYAKPQQAFAILQFLYPELDYKNRKIHIDHIFPKSKFKRTNKLLNKEFIGRENDLFNLQLLEGDENASKSKKDPEVWLSENEDNIADYKKRNFIKKDLPLTWDNIEEFAESRRQMIIDELKKQLLPKRT